MAGPATILRELHRLQRHLQDLQNEIDRGPRTLKAQEAKAAKQEESLKDANEAVKKLKVSIHEKEVSLKIKVDDIAKHQKQLNEITSKKEYDALQAEIASGKRACQKLEDDILDVMTEVEAKTARIPEIEKQAKQIKADVYRVVDDIQTRRNGLVDLVVEARKQLKEVEATLPQDVKAQYDRMVAVMGAQALASVHGRTCTACHTEITAQNYNELMQGRYVPCKSCGRLLYLPE